MQGAILQEVDIQCEAKKNRDHIKYLCTLNNVHFILIIYIYVHIHLMVGQDICV